MFRTCGSFTISLSGLRSPRLPHQWRRHAQTAVASQGSIGGSSNYDAKDESQHEPLPRSSAQPKVLKPVPLFLNAIFEPIQKRPWWYDFTDGGDLQRRESIRSRTRRALLPFDIHDAASLNALASRCQALGSPVLDTATKPALPVAMREPTALKPLLNAIQPKERWTGRQFGKLFLEIVAGLVEVSQERGLRAGTRRRAQYLQVITGYPFDGEQTHDRSRRSALCSWAERSFTPKGDFWPVYIHLVDLYAGPVAVQEEWTNYSARLATSLATDSEVRAYAISLRRQSFRKPGQKRLPTNYFRPLLSTRGKTGKSRRTARKQQDPMRTDPIEWKSVKAYGFVLWKNARNATIQALLRSDAWREAWNLVYPCRKPALVITPRSWTALLKYPEGLKGMKGGQQWLPEMEAPAIEMLSQEVANIESSLGLTWSGGEDGHHVKTGDPFWVKEDASGD